MTNVRIIYGDTGTGCDDQRLEVDVPEVTLQHVCDAIKKSWEAEIDYTGDVINLTPVAWVPNVEDNPDHYSFVLRWNEPWFGNVLVHGVVYTIFR